MVLSILRRQRLLDNINEPSVAPITLITAPAGYGKSTLARQWAETFPGPVAYITLRSESNTVSHINGQVMRAFRDAAPDIDFPIGSEPPLSDILDYGRMILGKTGKIGIIFDDYHAIENQDVHDSLNSVLHDLSAGVSVVIVSRTMPPFSLGRMYLYGQVRHLTDVDLSFTPDEIARISTSALLSDEEVRKLAERTEGWIAGIRLGLMSIALEEGAPGERLRQFLATLPQHQWLDEYIVGEVLDRLPEDLRQFVLQTSILEFLTPELCNDMLEVNNSAMLLQELEQNIVFVGHDGMTNNPLTYHRLFAECVDRISRRFISPKKRRQHQLACRALVRAS